jgi:hypothetical protein
MCGRFVRKGEPKKVAEALGVVAGEENWTDLTPMLGHIKTEVRMVLVG